jgi:trehalose 6-phosphate synthase
MPISLRFVVPLALALAAIAYAVQPLVDRLTLQWFVRDLDTRGTLIAKTAQEPLVELMREPRGAKLRVVRYFERIIQGERIFALGFCDRAGKLAYATAAFPPAVRCVAGE